MLLTRHTGNGEPDTVAFSSSCNRTDKSDGVCFSKYCASSGNPVGDIAVRNVAWTRVGASCVASCVKFVNERAARFPICDFAGGVASALAYAHRTHSGNGGGYPPACDSCAPFRGTGD